MFFLSNSTFALVDCEGQCFPVTVYNLSSGAGFVVGDSVAIPEPYVQVTDMIEDEKVCFTADLWTRIPQGKESGTLCRV